MRKKYNMMFRESNPVFLISKVQLPSTANPHHKYSILTSGRATLFLGSYLTSTVYAMTASFLPIMLYPLSRTSTSFIQYFSHNTLCKKCEKEKRHYCPFSILMSAPFLNICSIVPSYASGL